MMKLLLHHGIVVLLSLSSTSTITTKAVHAFAFFGRGGRGGNSVVDESDNCHHGSFALNVSMEIPLGETRDANFGYGFIPCQHWGRSTEPYILDLSTIRFFSMSKTKEEEEEDSNVIVDVMIGTDFPPNHDKFQCCDPTAFDQPSSSFSSPSSSSCRAGHLIRPPETQRMVPLLYSSSFTLSHDKKKKLSLLPDPSSSSHHHNHDAQFHLEGPHVWMLVSHCSTTRRKSNTESDSIVVMVEGSLKLHLLHGQLSEFRYQQYQMLITLIILYTLLLLSMIVWWAVTAQRRRRQEQQQPSRSSIASYYCFDCTTTTTTTTTSWLHRGIGMVMMLGWIEVLLWMIRFHHIQQGQTKFNTQMRIMTYTIVFTGAMKNALGRSLVLWVHHGWGIIMMIATSSSSSWAMTPCRYPVMAFGVLYFFLTTAPDWYRIIHNDPTHASTVEDRWKEYGGRQVVMVVLNTIFFGWAAVAWCKTKRRAMPMIHSSSSSSSSSSNDGADPLLLLASRLRWLQCIMLLTFLLSMGTFLIPIIHMIQRERDGNHVHYPPNRPYVLSMSVFWIILLAFALLFLLRRRCCCCTQWYDSESSLRQYESTNVEYSVANMGEEYDNNSKNDDNDDDEYDDTRFHDEPDANDEDEEDGGIELMPEENRLH